MPIFGEYAGYYDLIYPDAKFKEEAAFVDGLIREHGAAPSRILDMGCGTGRHAEALAALGYEVTGVDGSPSMLALAEKRNSGKGIGLVQADLRDFQLETQFDAVASFFHVMSYMTDAASLESAFAGAGRHLVDGGLFVFDFWFSPAVKNLGAEARTSDYPLDKGRLVRTVTPNTVSPTRIDVRILMQAFDEEGRELASFEETHAMKSWDVDEVEKALLRTGFSPLHFGQWMTGGPPDHNAWGAYALARRA